MKLYAAIAVFIFLFMLFVPLLALSGDDGTDEPTAKQTEAVSESTANETKAAERNVIDVFLTEKKRVVSLDMYDYIVGVVAAEMPVTYHEQALMAQAVAAYTYAMYVKNSGGAQGADITDSSASYQSYLDEQTLREKWGDSYGEYIEKIRSAVDEVYPNCLCLDGKPIMSVYHALNTGRTESAKNIWGKDISYLQSVTSTGDVLSPDFSVTIALKDEQFRILAEEIDGVSLGDDADSWVSEAETSESGTVTGITVGGKKLTGRDIRTAFSLKSAAFTLSHKDGVFTFVVQGSGHLAGMSQYGADYMARQGSSWKEILRHYYTGAEITELT